MSSRVGCSQAFWCGNCGSYNGPLEIKNALVHDGMIGRQVECGKCGKFTIFKVR